VIAVLLLSCNASDDDRFRSAQERYADEPTVENAVVLAEQCNHNHSDSLEDTKEGIEEIDRLITNHPESHRLVVLKGNLLTLLSGHYADDEDYVAALETIASGFELIDRTVRDHPDDPYVRIYRAINGASVPEMFNRRDIAAADFEKLLEAGEAESGREVTILSLYHYSRLLGERGEQSKADAMEQELRERYPDYRRVVEL
jgi:hypothetical protein